MANARVLSHIPIGNMRFWISADIRRHPKAISSMSARLELPLRASATHPQAQIIRKTHLSRGLLPQIPSAHSTPLRPWEVPSCFFASSILNLSGEPLKCTFQRPQRNTNPVCDIRTFATGMLPNELKHPHVYRPVYRPIRLCLICHNCIWCGAHPHHDVTPIPGIDLVYRPHTLEPPYRNRPIHQSA